MPGTLIAAALLALACDQAAKLAAVAAGRDDAHARRLGIFRYVRNPGRLHLLRRPSILVAVWTFEITLLLVLATAGPWSGSTAAQAGFGLVIGGASGNFLDRLLRGAIVDFVDLRVWPIFNLADVSVVCGVVMVALFPA
jgi:signal peptidase II